MIDHPVLPIRVAIHSSHCEIPSGTRLELTTEHNLPRLLQPCGLVAMACMWPVWVDVTVQLLIDHKHAP